LNTGIAPSIVTISATALPKTEAKMRFGLPAASLLICYLFSNPASAQSQQKDSVFYQSAVANTLSVYFNQLGDQSQIYNGSLYPELDLNFREGSPYFLGQKINAGSVSYDSIFYPNLSLIYDDYRQFVVAIDQSFMLKLINERISSFTIADHHFDRISTDSLTRGISVAGFYEVLYNGRSRLLKHTNKTIREVLSSSEGIIRYMDESNDYYIKRGEAYFHVTSKKELLNFVGDHKKEVQRFIRKNKLNYRRDKDKTLIQVTAYYDQIANK
jgi:hypothetical protein